ncbi:MAG: hypothetical protein WD737_14355 [Gemmatimonadota bacterium]
MNRISPLAIMRSRLARRLSTSVLSAAFLLAGGGDLVGQTACAHHDLDQQGPPTTHEGEHGTAHDAGHGDDAQAEVPHTGHGGEHDTPCTCIGTCHVAGVVATPPLGGATVVSAAETPAPAIVSSDEVVVARTLLRLLPFANGPPRLA